MSMFLSSEPKCVGIIAINLMKNVNLGMQKADCAYLVGWVCIWAFTVA